MGWINRMTTALNAFWLTYNGANGAQDTQLVPLEEFDWGSPSQRMKRYATFDAYHYNLIYSKLYKAAMQRLVANNYYKFTRVIYNPVARQNDLLRAYIAGGAFDIQDMTGGVLPIVSDNRKRLINPLKQLITWSRLPELFPLYVSGGARLGDAPLKIVDDPERGKVWIEQLDPRKVRYPDFDSVGNVKGIIIEYERDEEADLAVYQPGKVHPLERNARSYLYTERIYKDDRGVVRFEFFKDGKPFDYKNNVEGGELSAYDSDYPFVPVAWGGHQATTFGFYQNAFALATPKIDEINDGASLLNDQIRKSVNVVWAYTGVGSGGVEFSQTERDKTPYVKLPVGGDVKAMVAPLDITGALANLQGMLGELERDMPELALQRVREQSSSMTAPGIRAAYSDAIGRIQLARASYNAALVRAFQMGITIGGMRGYEGFAGFNEQSYDNGEMQMHIGERPVIADELSKQDRIIALGSVNNVAPPLQRLMLEAMDYSDEDVKSVTDDAEARQERDIRNAARGFGQSVFGDDEDEDAEDQDEETAR